MDELNHGNNKKSSTNPIFKIENYFQMDPVNIWASNLGLKINIWPFMQPNISLIKKLMMHIDFLGKNISPVGRAKLSSTSVVILFSSKQVKCPITSLEKRVLWTPMNAPIKLNWTNCACLVSDRAVRGIGSLINTSHVSIKNHLSTSSSAK